MAQLVERDVRNVKAVGSNPIISTIRVTAPLVTKKKKQAFGTVLQRTVLQEYGISRKRYAVFCVCGHKCSACQEKLTYEETIITQMGF